MKKIFLVVMMIGMAFCAMAQQPQIDVNTKVTYSTASGTSDKPNQNDKVHVSPEDLVLKPGVDNVIKFSVDGVKDNQLIVKVVSEDLCNGRKGEKFGEYILTPKADKGKVIVRVGAMDFMGAFVKHGEVEFTIGEVAEITPVAPVEVTE